MSCNEEMVSRIAYENESSHLLFLFCGVSDSGGFHIHNHNNKG